jgi:hypothetical protein
MNVARPAALAAAVSVAALAAATPAEPTGEANASARCPKALNPTTVAPTAVAAAVRREVPKAYAGPEYRGYEVTTFAALRPGLFVPAGVSVYRGIAAAQCGASVANRSWVVFLFFPRAPGASLSQGVAFFARTAAGWTLWYRYR